MGAGIDAARSTSRAVSALALAAPWLNEPNRTRKAWYPPRKLDRWMKSGELIRRLEADGRYRVRQRGSHAIYRHPTKEEQLSVPAHPSKEIPWGTEARLLKTAG
jgi:mRNA interferase HicA